MEYPEERKVDTESRAVRGPLAWLTAHKSVCVLSVLLGLVALGALNRDLLADAYLAAASNPHEETAKLFPADTTVMYVSVTNVGVLLREDEKIGEIIKKQAGDLGGFGDEIQGIMDTFGENLLGQKIRTKDDLQALGLLNGSAALGVCYFDKEGTSSTATPCIVVLKSSKAAELAKVIFQARKKAFGEKGSGYRSVKEDKAEHNGCEIQLIKAQRSIGGRRYQVVCPVCVLGDNVVFFVEADEEGQSLKIIKNIIDTYKGTNPSLYDDKPFKACMGRLSSDRLVSFYGNKDNFFKTLMRRSGRHEDRPVYAYIAERVGDLCGELLLKDGALRLNAFADLPKDSPMRTIFAAPRVQGERFVSADGLLAYAEIDYDIDGAWKIFDGFVAATPEKTQKQTRESLAAFTEATGVDVKKDLGPAIKPQAFIALYDLPAGPDKSASLDCLFGVKVGDAAKAQALIEKLLKGATKGKVQPVKSGKIGRYEVTELKLDADKKIVWAFVGDCLLAAGDRERLKKGIDVFEGKAPAFAPPAVGCAGVWIDMSRTFERVVDLHVNAYEKCLTDCAEDNCAQFRGVHADQRKVLVESVQKNAKEQQEKFKVIRALGKVLNPAVAVVKSDKDGLVLRLETTIGKPAPKSNAAGEMAEIAQVFASVGIALLVLVAGVCCFIPRRSAA